MFFFIVLAPGVALTIGSSSNATDSASKLGQVNIGPTPHGMCLSDETLYATVPFYRVSIKVNVALGIDKLWNKPGSYF